MNTIKNIQTTIVSMCLGILVCSCEHYSTGSDFVKSDINQIVKGKTTTSELMNILGTPYSETPAADGGQRWSYFCNRNSLAAVPLPDAAVVTTTKQRSDLTVLINKDKVVVDYTFNEGPTNRTTTVGIGVPVPGGHGTALLVPITITSTNSK